MAPKKNPSQLEQLNPARERRRRRFTAVSTEILSLYAKKDLDVTVLDGKFRELKDHMSAMEEYDTQILELMNEAGVEELLIEQDEEKSASFQSVYYRCESICERVLAKQEAKETTVKPEDAKKYRLPKIELKKFSGDLKDWINWWSQFEQIHLDKGIADVDKFQYLSQSMVPDSPASRIVSAYPQSALNYQAVVGVLKERFGRKDLLSELYVREFISLVMSRNADKNKQSVASLYDEIKCKDNAVTSLNINADKYVDILKTSLIESCLPPEVLKAWQRKERDEQDPVVFGQLMEFLQQEVSNEMRTVMAYDGFGVGKSSSQEFKNKPRNEKRERTSEEIPTASGLMAHSSGHQKVQCVFCSGQHASKDCRKAKGMDMQEKVKAVQKVGMCFNCLEDRQRHLAAACPSKSSCAACHKKHHVLLCRGLTVVSKLQKEEGKSSVKSSSLLKQEEEVVTSIQQHAFTDPGILLKTVMVTIVGRDGPKKIRILLDSGAQRSCVLERTAQEVGLRATGVEKVVHGLFGGGKTAAKIRKRYEVVLEALGGGYKCQFEMLDEPAICHSIPPVPRGPWENELRRLGINLHNQDNGCHDIEVLIGSDVYGDLMTGRKIKLDCGLVAWESVFGWTLQGSMQRLLTEIHATNALSVITSLYSASSVTELWDLESIGIKDPVESKSRKDLDIEAKNHFLSTVTQGTDGRYEVQLPWTMEPGSLQDNRDIAEKRLRTASRKLQGMGLWKEYDKIFEDWNRDGIIEVVPEDEMNQSCHYLPHRAVIKPQSSTTRVRPVFDASCRRKNALSLNDFLEKGPNLLELIPAVLLRFREKRIGVVADIRKAFLQIGIHPGHRDYLRFLWWEDDSETAVRVYRHRRVVFGVSCSPFLLGAVMEHHLSKVKEEDKDRAERLWKSFYVDNCVTSVNSYAELEEFQHFAVSTFATARMELCMWESSAGDGSGVRSADCGLEPGSHSSVGANDSCTTVLGILWDKEQDELRVKLDGWDAVTTVTKRVVLSWLQRIYDPLGFLSPVTLKPKLLLQDAWVTKMGWDQPLTDEHRKRFEDWMSSLEAIKAIGVPRRFGISAREKGSWTLHTFCDASQLAYAAIVFLRCEDAGEVSVQMLMSKSRVAPVKKATIPRLELLAALIGARLSKFVSESLELEVKNYFWSDSSTAIAWIQRMDNWGVFVSNRVKEIRVLTDPLDWKHIPGAENPADLPSRGCDAGDLLRKRWWEGPDWLRPGEENWPVVRTPPNEDEVSTEKKKTIVLTTVAVPIAPWYDYKFSRYDRMLRMMAYLLRWKHFRQGRTGDISAEEIQEAETKLFWIAQGESKVKEKCESSMELTVGADGLVRVITKITEGQDGESFKYPILLPADHRIIEMMMREVHLTNCHAGVQICMRILRERFWIVRSRQVLKKIVSSCGACRRFSVKQLDQEGIGLPSTRVEQVAVFAVTGVDLCGPLFLKGGSKVWIVLFTCGVYRAVHLELVTSISTEAFLQAFRRFVSRRMRPSIVYSDQGSNFVGLANILKTLDWERIKELHALEKIDWRLNPPASPWWGGWWERLIRIVKGLLLRILGRRTVVYEELMTVICEVEAVVNSRPLTYISEDSNDLLPLCPSMFLKGGLVPDGISDIETLDAVGLRRRHQYQLKLMAEFKSRFRSEYLSTLVQRATEKGRTKVNVGDVVLIGSEDKKRILWPIGRVIEVIPGRDGAIRVVKLKTATGELVRPIQKLYPLEVEMQEEDVVIEDQDPDNHVDTGAASSESVVRTRSGRVVKVPARLGF